MKKVFLKFAALSLAAFTFNACDEDELNDTPSSIAIQFAQSELTIDEGYGSYSVVLNLARTASEDGYVKVSFTPSITEFVTLSPAPVNGVIRVPIAKNANAVSIVVTPIDNTSDEENRSAVFTLTEASEAYTIGSQSTYNINVQDDDVAAEPVVSLTGTDVVLRETDGEWYTVTAQITAADAANGSVVFGVNSDKAVYGTHYETEPAFTNNRLTVDVQPGTTAVSFKVKPINDNIIAGDLELTFSIVETTGNLKKGPSLSRTFDITDDELTGKPKGYESAGGGWSSKKTYEYTATGKIAKIHWETRTPGLLAGVDTYYYNANDEVIRVNHYPGSDTHYFYENGKIIREEKVNAGVLKGYTEYAYDDYGNVGAYRTYYLQPDGSYALSANTLLLYYTDGNLYKKIVYHPSSTEEHELIISEATFEHYIEKENPFPMVQIFPNVKTQENLFTTYKLKSGGMDLVYYLSYEYNSDGTVSERRTSQGNSVDVVTYHYY